MLRQLEIPELFGDAEQAEAARGRSAAAARRRVEDACRARARGLPLWHGRRRCRTRCGGRPPGRCGRGRRGREPHGAFSRVGRRRRRARGLARQREAPAQAAAFRVGRFADRCHLRSAAAGSFQYPATRSRVGARERVDGGGRRRRAYLGAARDDRAGGRGAHFSRSWPAARAASRGHARARRQRR